MNADLNGVGNTPDDKDRLHSSVMNGASKSALSLRRHVGIGSLVHCLSGSLRIAVTTSSMSSVWNVDSTQFGGAAVNDGGGASAVEARTPATLRRKIGAADERRLMSTETHVRGPSMHQLTATYGSNNS